jgi:hypothetical protein
MVADFFISKAGPAPVTAGFSRAHAGAGNYCVVAADSLRLRSTGWRPRRENSPVDCFSVAI